MRLGARRIGVLTPYRRDVNEIVHAYITRHGYEVPVFGSFNEEMDPVVATIDADSLIAAIDTIRDGYDLDAVFVSCTSVRLADSCRLYRSPHRVACHVVKPCAGLALLRLAGIEDAIEGRGRLFETGLAATA